MKTFNVALTSSQIRDLLAITDQASVKAIQLGAELDVQGKHKAGTKMGAYADRLLDIVDILEACVAALDVAGK